ncbi:MAG TPA: hypothetical protein VF593_00265, partial [Chthoniobacteraceae bacterium]
GLPESNLERDQLDAGREELLRGFVGSVSKILQPGAIFLIAPGFLLHRTSARVSPAEPQIAKLLVELPNHPDRTAFPVFLMQFRPVGARGRGIN